MVSVTIVYHLTQLINLFTQSTRIVFVLCWFHFISLLFARGSEFCAVGFFSLSLFPFRSTNCQVAWMCWYAVCIVISKQENLIPKYNLYMYLAEPKNNIYELLLNDSTDWLSKNCMLNMKIPGSNISLFKQRIFCGWWILRNCDLNSLEQKMGNLWTAIPFFCFFCSRPKSSSTPNASTFQYY